MKEEGKDFLKEKNDSFKTCLAELDKKYKGTVVKFKSDIENHYEVTPSGSISLDKALGIGGYPKGRIVEMFGPEFSGKSSLALKAVSESQKVGGRCVYIDAEHSLDPRWATLLGVDMAKMVIIQPDYGEQALEVVDSFVRSEAADIIVVDSVAALVPKKEIEGEMGDQQYALQARMMGQGLRKLTGIVSKSKTTLIFVNQLREKIGMFVFGRPEETPGGRALKFYSSIRMSIRQKGGSFVKDPVTKIPLSHTIFIEIIKNKCSIPYRTAEIYVDYKKGFDKTKEISELAIKEELVKLTGITYEIEGQKAAGKGKFLELLENKPELVEMLEKKLLEKKEFKEKEVLLVEK